jgi:hypothetical protein
MTHSITHYANYIRNKFLCYTREVALSHLSNSILITAGFDLRLDTVNKLVVLFTWNLLFTKKHKHLHEKTKGKRKDQYFVFSRQQSGNLGHGQIVG